jgi:hypothetical protein
VFGIAELGAGKADGVSDTEIIGRALKLGLVPILVPANDY